MIQLQKSEIVIPAEAGTQSFQEFLDPAFVGVTPFIEFCNYLIIAIFSRNRRV